jgi:tRNA uridine 5-carboxymethylaminomethyl modification enzyme
MYVNGLSTSLPADVQEAVVRVVPGLRRARFLQYGYAVEYDVVAPRQVRPTMAVDGVPGLWVAGQLIGTSGYEEAAALGLVAGINVVRQLRSEPRFVPTREESYIGVLVDDMSGRDHREPYRMLTSRAEHRLVLGAESARERLMPVGRELGLVPDRVFHVERSRWERRRQAREALESARLNPDRDTVRAVRALAGVELAAPTTWAGVLRRHDVDAGRVLRELPELAELDMDDRQIVVGLLRYDGYRQRSEHERRRVERLRSVPIPQDFAAAGVPGLSREVVEALTTDRPRTLAEAERLAAMTPAALAILAGFLQRK